MKKSLITAVLTFCLVFCSCTPAKKIVNPEQNNNVEENRIKTVRDVKTVEEKGPQSKAEISPDKEEKNAKTETDKTEADKPKSAPEEEKIKPKQPSGSNQSKPKEAEASYTVKVDISDQKVYVYNGSEEIKAMTCSTGTQGHETPEGTFKIGKKGEWFFSEEFKQGGKFWVGFIGGTYLFHSVPMDRNQKIIEEEAVKLGTAASHGCVRLSVDDAYWFYNTIPRGSKVEIVK